ncbi:MAG: Ni/Fe hydrogenase subunit alpha [Anaerolineales bacterium]|nr:Ni/Fe hydrogenase subunit alpha [Anaerolineales bacterium]MCS7247332.1 Ni/Fe hydrogenase subunit alpha [Anaerolineales bacterium]MDW8161143.1 Ni/Fe hydrogenase subunit alpha [Anaerolineales bacterium]MDW8447297.1 Ni/Fe hydrogenase subunit alpha [Anaerolineales bacterium]
MNKRIDVHHVTRVEGHGNIVVEIENGELKTCRFEVVETPRFFEAMLLGRPYQEASHITSRICGICATGHATASLRASEKALGVELSEQSWLLRKLTFHGEILDSHVLHVYMLVAPDFLGVGSVIPLAQTHPEIVMRALRMKKLAGDLCAMVTGRHTHPIAMVVGGFTHFPKMSELEAMHRRLIDSRRDVEATVELFSKLPWPEFERDTEYVSLSKPDEYAFIDGEIVTSDGVRVPPERYKEVTNEFMVPYSTAKFTRNKRESLMVGALARFNNNYDLLHPKAKEAAAVLGMKPKVTNTFLNSAAQVVEIVHSIEDSIRIVEELLSRGIQPEEPAPVKHMPGEGVGVAEVPRGLLIHHYAIGEDGRITAANCIIPTNQNINNLEHDMRAWVPKVMHKPEQEMRLDLEMLVRAYDPCISCSVHVLKIQR